MCLELKLVCLFCIKRKGERAEKSLGFCLWFVEKNRGYAIYSSPAHVVRLRLEKLTFCEGYVVVSPIFKIPCVLYLYFVCVCVLYCEKTNNFETTLMPHLQKVSKYISDNQINEINTIYDISLQEASIWKDLELNKHQKQCETSRKIAMSGVARNQSTVCVRRRLPQLPRLEVMVVTQPRQQRQPSSFPRDITIIESNNN